MGREQRSKTGSSSSGAKFGDDCSRQHGSVHKTRGCIGSSSQRDASSDGLSTSRDGDCDDQGRKQLRNAHKIWGKCLASLRGKTYKKSSPVPAPVQQHQVLSVDVMYLETTAILVAISTPLDMTLAVSLTRLDTDKTSRAAAVVKPALNEMISILKSRNFLVQVIMSNGEGAIGKMRLDLLAMGN